jgi:secretion/DNA translocation related TadE-like protein
VKASAERRGEEGSIAIVMLAVVMVSALIMVALGQFTAGVVARGRADTAADAAALAGGIEVARGSPSTACDVASSTASMNGAQLVRCRVVQRSVDVVVERVVTIGVAGATARGYARVEVDDPLAP